MTSHSRVDLEARLREVELLLDLIQDNDDPDETSGQSDNALRRACVVLLSAHLEGYLEDLVAEVLDALVASEVCVDDLPLQLRAVHVEEHLREIAPIRDMNKRAPRIEKMLTEESPLWVSGALLEASMIRSKMICKHMDNPGSTEIRQFFRLVGLEIKDVLAELGELEGLYRVDGLVGIRNGVAHGEVGTPMTTGDVSAYVSVVRHLTDLVDQAASKHVQDVCSLPSLPW
jgi:hypothetical protein